MQKIILLTLIVALTTTGMAGSFQTALIDDDLDKFATMTGEIIATQSKNTITVVVDYQLSRSSEAVTEITIPQLNVILANSDGSVAEQSITDVTLNGDPTTGILKYSIDPATTVTGLSFNGSQDVTWKDGETTQEQLKGTLQHDIYRPAQRQANISSITTHNVTVFRDQAIHLSGRAYNTSQVTVQNTTATVTDNSFTASIPAPQTPAGKQTTHLTATTPDGSQFQLPITITIQNREPTINSISVPDKTHVQDDVTINIEASDDHAIEQVEGRIGNITYTADQKNSDYQITFPAAMIDIGNHTVTITVTDSDNTTATQQHEFSIIEEQEGASDEEDEDDELVEQPDSIPVIGAVRSFIENLILSIIG